jgi:hypothetical protein
MQPLLDVLALPGQAKKMVQKMGIQLGCPESQACHLPLIYA